MRTRSRNLGGAKGSSSSSCVNKLEEEALSSHKYNDDNDMMPIITNNNDSTATTNNTLEEAGLKSRVKFKYEALRAFVVNNNINSNHKVTTTIQTTHPMVLLLLI